MFFILYKFINQITRILEDSLGGNCKTTMLAMISPSTDAFNHSVHHSLILFGLKYFV